MSADPHDYPVSACGCYWCGPGVPAGYYSERVQSYVCESCMYLDDDILAQEREEEDSDYDDAF